jgi:thiol-disulfide isomerase/thioredoxin/DNA-binding beta-propeller fold protein YncE
MPISRSEYLWINRGLTLALAAFSLLAISCSPASQAIGDEDEPKRAATSPTDPAAGDKQPTDEKAAADKAADGDEPEEKPTDEDFPFPHRIKSPSLDGGVAWINTAGPIDIKDLKGKFVVLDFWTYCCINCIQVLPELHKLEKAYPKNVVVIGVHSAKFETEKDTKNIEEAVLRYEIEHPVINDANSVLFRKFGATGWPAIRIIDPEGYFIGGEGGEVPFEAFDAFFKKAIPVYAKRGSLDETPLHFDLLAHKAAKTPLRFPGKVLADEKSNRLFITDSNHNRIVVTDLAGKLLETIGSGAIGRTDGDFAAATFDHPQGLAILGDTLYVADTENHLLRKVHLKTKQVTTIAGTGIKASSPWPGMDKVERGPFGPAELPERWVGKPRETGLASPWALWVHGPDLYIAMAGPHQIWKMPLDESEIGPYAGNGREDIVDGQLLPQWPYMLGFASFAQPSGLASDGTWLYVADSEGSSIRAVPFDPKKEVETVVGTNHLPDGRLFEFGDADGEGENVKLQHVLGVTHVDGLLYIADTYNNKIKVVDIKKKSAKTIAGTGKPGKTDDPATFDEPAGVSYAAGKLYIADTNNHAIRTIDLKNNNQVATLTIDGLAPPKPPKPEIAKPSFDGATVVKVDSATVRPSKTADGKPIARLSVRLKLPAGWKTNALAPTSYYVEATNETGPVDRAAVGKIIAVEKPTAEFDIDLPLASQDAAKPATGDDPLTILVTYYYCQEGDGGICKIANLAFEVPLKVDGEAKEESAILERELE